MDQLPEVLRVVALTEAKSGPSGNIAPHELIEDLTAEFSCTFEHARDAVFAAIDLGMIRLTPSYFIVSANSQSRE